MKPLCLLFFVAVYVAGIAQNPVDSVGIVLIGGLRQSVSIRGEDDTKPLLLFLHGGPGSSMMGYAHRFSDRLEKHFVVVHWDQRDTGKTLRMNASPSPLTVSLFRQDTHEMVMFLLNKFKQRKLFLAGHSWGTSLGFYIAANYPELLHAYVAVCPMVDQLESERIALRLTREKAQAAGNTVALKELSMVNVPFENGEQLFYHRKWLSAYAGSNARLTKDAVMKWADKWLAVFNEASGVNLMRSVPAVRCPVYIMVGRNDLQTNAHLAESYYNILEAPLKQLFRFERSGHYIPTSEPGLLQDRIVELLTTLTPPIHQTN